ncbi:molybdopterin molybdochelatase /molybdenum cofactor cytidylyltransferase [Arboricoccus pini]|uniref:Molybdopterin molybdochelatase /molybdenum cofactor cytidylyltransferase n=1 Tax=Arboricoccus pini TaxID=1963835 RepID=A0A212QU23_9PROT|nr:molybdopterin-binding/glycosyltransferase family 2 protein [Arboricoccus pini]SNB62971.1 molybdopterin molybdochelatase /molybdenum cofactor cytidylyltransferase [Arboricoccus pini]
MRFGPLAIEDAENAILAHALVAGATRFKKGQRLGVEDLRSIADAGIRTVIAATLEPGDLAEDVAAERLVQKIGGSGTAWHPATTGRANLFSTTRGLLVLDEDRINALNAIDEAITLATLPPFSLVPDETMLATIKIIPFAVPKAAIETALALLRRPLCRIASFVPKRAWLIQTVLPGTSTKMLDKTVRITNERLVAVNATLVGESRCAHEEVALISAIKAAQGIGFDLLLIAGASATTDRHDVLPASICAVGGSIERFGMPVDPGNLLVLGQLDSHPVIGLPGCARSPKLNGFDWILERVAADLPVSAQDFTRMGVGGLLMEIPSRPQPRDSMPSESSAPPRSDIAAVVLAAGRSTRMGGPNKLLATVNGVPMVRHAVQAALASPADEVLVVTGHDEQAVRDALLDLRPGFVHNSHYRSGLSTSLQAAINALSADIEAIIVMLGDMPLVTESLLERLIAAFDVKAGHTIVVPTYAGQRGNPILLGRRHFNEILTISGDVGARNLIAAHPEAVIELPTEDNGTLLDIDTPEALDELIGRLRVSA